jgi:hypothetical protein
VINIQDDKNKMSEWRPESLMDLLIAQCSDLEGLLALARRETVAANRNDFDELLTVFGDRAKLGDRLESYHLQVAELRAKLGAYVDPTLASKNAQLVIEIQRQDAKTSLLLVAAQSRLSEEITRLDHSQRNSHAYLQGALPNGLYCDRRG